MKFGAKALTRLRLRTPTIRSVGICTTPRSIPAEERSGGMKSSSTGRQGDCPFAAQARYSF